MDARYNQMAINNKLLNFNYEYQIMVEVGLGV